MKNYLLAGILVLLLSSISFSQTTYKLSGVVVDSAKGYGLVDVNVSIISRDNNEVLTGGTTGEKGNFTVENIKNKNVRAKFSFVGYQTKIVDSVSLENTSKMVIKLRGTGIMLPEVVIKTVKPMIELKIDRQVINIDQVPGASASVTDALRNSGAVEVNPTNNSITVRGQAVKIQMDGRPFEMPNDMLANMPSEMLDQVEVILAPGAKESAEGGTYILNLISKKTILDSYNGSVSLNTSTANRNFGSLNFNYKRDKVNVFGAFFGGLGGQRAENNTEQINYNSVNLFHQKSEGDMEYRGTFLNAKLGVDYNLDDNNLFTFYGTFNRFAYDGDNQSLTNIFNNNEVFQRSFNNDINSEFNNSSSTLYGFYKKKYESNKGQELTFDAMYTDIRNPQSSEMSVLYSNDPLYPKLHNTDTKEKSNTFIFKSDFIYPSAIGRFETGYHFTYRERENDYTSLDYLYGTNSWQDSMKLGNLFKYNEDIHAAYVTYSKGFGKFDLKTGLRVENLNTKGDQLTTNENFTQNFFNLFPNLNLSYKFNDMMQITFNAFRRVRYPQLYYVNPFKSYNSPNSYSEGNPSIKPQFINSFALDFSRYINVYYVYSTDVFNRVSSVINDSISISSMRNAATNETYGLELTLPYYNSPMMPFHLPDFIASLNVQFGYTYRKQTGSYLNENLNLTGYSKWLRFSMSLNLWYDINSSIFAMYNPRQETKRDITEATVYMGINFSKAFMDQKLRVNLGISDPFNISSYKSKSFGTAFSSRNDYIPRDSRSINLSISYRINDYKERRDRNIDDGRDASDTPKLN